MRWAATEMNESLPLTDSKPSRKSNRIELQLREIAQLFNSMDPSPFQDRDLDADAEEFIVSWARELAARHELELIIHLSSATSDSESEIERAVQHYFRERANMKALEFRMLMRHGRTSLLVGLLFLTSCLFAGQLSARLGQGTIAAVTRESLSIGGWVAMWRPLQIYLYDWWPLLEQRRVLERLSRMRVRIGQPGK